MWVLAGGNGAGKTTFYREFLKPLGVKFVNADIVADKLNKTKDSSYLASQIVAKMRKDLLSRSVSFCYETVFSHPSKIDFVASAKAQGYEVILIYIHLKSAQLNQARVAQRVETGGHDVPAEKITTRIPRTMKHIRTAIQLVDQVKIYDNSSLERPFQEVAHLVNNRITNQLETLPSWANEILHGSI